MSYDEINLDSKAVGKLQEVVGGGGATYTAGNGITITEENVISADTKVIEYNGVLTSIPSSILESLNTGDVLNVFGVYYFVNYKTEMDISITRIENGAVWQYSYSKNGDYFQYFDQDTFYIPRYIDPAYLGANEGDIDFDTYDQIQYFHYCETDYGMAISIGWDDEKDTPKLSTVVQDNKYYTVAFTYNEPEDEEEDGTYSYVITEHTLGGGIEFVPIDIEATSINLETLEKLVDFNNQTLRPNFIVLGTDNETDTFPILMPSDNLQGVYRSAVMGSKYYQLALHINEEGADVSIRQISLGGGGGIDNLCDYYPNLSKINGKQMFNYGSYYLDVDAFVQYVEDSGIGDIPFEPDTDDTYPNGIELIANVVSGLGVRLQTQTSNSNSYLSIEFADDTVTVNDLINEEGDTLLEFLTRNKEAIKDVFNGAVFSGSNTLNMLDRITNNEMCRCMAWERADTNPTYIHSMNFIKFLELFKHSLED